MIILIDNYDSFSYNLYQALGALGQEVRVVRNDEIDADALNAQRPDAVVISPGPGHPKAAGNCLSIIERLNEHTALLGVCLGHQALCEALGATVIHARTLMHGKQSRATLDAYCALFKGLGSSMLVARYHSLAVDEDTLPDELSVIARTEDGEVMGVKHRWRPWYGIQFHPESILTPQGPALLKNFLHESRYTHD